MNNFNARIDKLPSNIITLIGTIDGLNGQWVGGANLSPQALGRLKRSVLFTSTGASTRIEGSKLSDAQVEKLMRGLSTQKLADRDSQEVKGYYELLKVVFESYKDIDITEGTLKYLHSELLKYASKDERHRGDYKKMENQVEMRDSRGNVISVLFETTPAYLTAKETGELIDWTRSALNADTYHPLLITANFIVEFLKIHPFLDGNGRMSRLLTNLLLLKAGYEFTPYVSHEKIVEENKADYYVALRQSQTTFGKPNETIEPWLLFFLGVLKTQSSDALKLLSAENVESLLSPSQLEVWTCFMNSDEELAVKHIVEATNVPRPTIKQAIERLLLLKKIERIGLGSTTRYRRV